MRLASGGWSGMPGLVLFLPAVRFLLCLWATSVESCFFYYLHVSLVGGPLQALPRSL